MALQKGDKIPNFTSIDVDGNVFNSEEFIGNKAVVIYFYPKDDTKVCTDQACSFRDNYEVFKELGAEVIGVSSDYVESDKKFEQK